ncbi:cupin domain-containing protein [Paenibacillus sp. TRM 82003]|nr:cupin domain-containing protein [Paenibacillus sp. TRM 82003]
MDIRKITDAMEYQQERFTKRILFQERNSVMFVLNFVPGQQLPVHTHPGAEVYLTVLTGGGTLTIDDQDYAVAKGDAIYCEGEKRFSFANDGDENVSLSVLLTKVPSPVYANPVG